MRYATEIGAPELDDRDRNTIALRMAAYNRVEGPRVGDFIQYADGRSRRIAHVWPADWHDDKIARCQPTDGGSFYLGGVYESPWHRARAEESGPADDNGYMSYSGALYPGIRANLLTLTEEKRAGSLWIFHHEEWGAGMGVNDTAPFRVYACAIAGSDPWNGDAR